MSVKVAQKSRLADLLHYRIRALTHDGRAYVGELLAFDAHMNLVLAECVEHRVPNTQLQILKNKTSSPDDGPAHPKLDTRTLGLVVLRGDQVLTTVVESAPVLSKKQRAVAHEKKQAQLHKHKRKGKGVVARATPATPAAIGAGRSDTAGPQQNSAPVQARPFQPPPGFRRR